MQPKNNQLSTNNCQEIARKKPFFMVDYVKNNRFGYKAGYNYIHFPQKNEVIISFSRSNVEIDLLFFYELRGSGINFNRVVLHRLVQLHIKSIESTYLNQLLYEVSK